MRLKVLGIAFVTLVAIHPAFSLGITDLDVNATMLFIGTTEALHISPLIPTLGVSLPIGIIGPLYVEPTIDVFSLFYEYTGTRAVPAAIEAGQGLFTIAGLLGVQLGVLFPVTESIDLGGGVGLDFLLRYPFVLSSNLPGSDALVSPVLNYFYGDGRFLYPETRIFLRWRAVTSMALVFSIRAAYPAFYLWDGEGLPLLDQLMIMGTLGFDIGLGGAPAK